MDLALACTAKPEALILAFDGNLMIKEDRLQPAMARFQECLEIAKPEESADDDYVARYCRLWLAINDERVGFEEIKSRAEEQNLAWPKASKFVQAYLPRSPIDALEKICGHRTAESLNDWCQPPHATFISTKTTFDL